MNTIHENKIRHIFRLFVCYQTVKYLTFNMNN